MTEPQGWTPALCAVVAECGTMQKLVDAAVREVYEAGNDEMHDVLTELDNALIEARAGIRNVIQDQHDAWVQSSQYAMEFANWHPRYP
jgi:hypothetical protein